MTRWHETPEAQALLAAIKAERPDCWYLRRYEGGPREPRYKGFTARAFRRLWEAERDTAMYANERDRWIELGEQHPDDIIDRMLAGADLALTEVHGDPLLGIAA